jgi:hypothetical protein
MGVFIFRCFSGFGLTLFHIAHFNPMNIGRNVSRTFTIVTNRVRDGAGLGSPQHESGKAES